MSAMMSGKRKPAETSRALKYGITADGANNHDAAKTNSPRQPESLSAKAKRKRRASVTDGRASGVFRNVDEVGEAPAASFLAISQEPGVVILGPLPPPSFSTRPSAGSRADSSRSHRGNSSIGATLRSCPTDCIDGLRSEHSGKISASVSAATKFASSHNHHVPNLPSPLDRVTPQSLCNGPSNHSDNVALHRPRKQSRGLLHDSETEEDMLQKKQGLIEQLRLDGSSDDDDFMSDDEGDVSGEDVFSEDDDERQGQLRRSAIREISFPSSSIPSTSFCWGEESHRRIGIETERANRTSVNGGAGQKQSSLRYQPSITAQSRYRSSHYTAGEMEELSHQGRASDFDANNGIRASTSNSSGHTAPESSQDVFARMHSNMVQQYNGRQDGFNPLTATSYSRENFVHSKALRRGSSASRRDREENNLKMSAIKEVASSSLPSTSSSREESHRRITAGMETERANRASVNGGAGQKQPSLGYQPSITAQSRYHSSHSTAGKMEELSHQGRASNFDANNVIRASRSNSSGLTAPESSQDVFARMHSNMSQQYHAKQDGSKPPTTTSYSRENSFHGRTSRRRTSTSSRDKRENNVAKALPKKENSNLEAQILQKEGLHHLQHSSSTYSAPLRNSSRRNPESNGSSPPSNCVAIGGAFCDRASYTSQSARYDHRVESRGSESMRCRDTSTPSNIAFGNIDRSDQTTADRSLSTRNTKASAVTLDSGRHSLNVIANMEAVMSQRSEGDARVSGKWKSKNSLDSVFFQRRASNGRSSGSLRGPSREVIASIEADMMLLEEEEERKEMGNHGPRYQHATIDPYGPDARSGSTHGSRQPAGMNQRDVLGLMIMQQQQRQQQGMPQHANGNTTLSDQISNMAIDRLHLESDDYSSNKSIDSCVSYDGKSTHIFASRARTHDQELACHALNDAICDLYGAPVKRILRQYPMVTRLIRADDEMGNIQLHYAVRNGNVKAIRRIVRADPVCALIRNIQGYCPLHFAVQSGNFAAVQQLCSMVPTSAEVQCEEGCLPLHEAVSSAAHLSDAPQIAAALINAFPSAIKITNDEGLLPLHLAAMSGFSAGIRTIFAYGFSTIYARENTEEMLPLDFAIDGYKTSSEEANETVQDRRIMDPNEQGNDAVLTEKEMEFRQCIDTFLMSALYDRPVFTPARSDQRGMTFLPIHGAAASQPCSQSWKQIVSMYGKVYASDVDVRGRTALHVLVTSKLYRLEVVIEMIMDIDELDPTSATTFDDSGLIPLHASLIYLAPYHVVERLLVCNWSAISIEVDEDCDNAEFRGMLPFQLAAACGCSFDIVNLLLRAHPIGVAGALLNDGS